MSSGTSSKVSHNSDESVSEEDIKGDVEIFREDVGEFHRMDRRLKELEVQIKPLRQEVSQIRSRKTELKGQICSFMKDNELGECAYNDGPDTFIYKYNCRRTKKPISAKTLRDDLNRFFTMGPGKENQYVRKTPIEKATILYDYLCENRDVRETDILSSKKA